MQILLKQLEQAIPKLAKEEILSRFKKISYTEKTDGSLLTEADEAMQHALTQYLRQLTPDIDVLGEEMSVDQQQAILDAGKTSFWIIDPLDGTTNFSMGLAIFSVSIALFKNNQIELGLIYDPIRDECFSAINNQGAFLNQQALKINTQITEIKQAVAQVDLKRLPADMAAKIAAQHPFRSQRNFGSGALDWCWLAANRSQLYVHGGQKLWDYAAGQLIFKEAGGYASDFNGEGVFKYCLDARSVIAATDKALLQKWRNFVLGV